MHKKYCDNEKLSPLGTLTTGESSDCQKTQESSRGPQPFRPGSARLHLLPRVLATNSETIDSSSRILRIHGIFRGLTVGIADSGSVNMQRGHGAIFAPENLIFQRKNRFLAGSAPEKSSIFSGDWRGWQWRGSLLPRPPACQNFFDKLRKLLPGKK